MVEAGRGQRSTAVAVGDEVMFTGLGIGSEGSYAEYALIAETQAVAQAGRASASSRRRPWASSSPPPSTRWSAGRRCSRRDRPRPGRRRRRRQRGRAARPRPRRARAGDGRTRGRRARVGELGADGPSIRTAADVAAEVRRLTEGKGVDVVIDLVVSANLTTDLAHDRQGRPHRRRRRRPRADGEHPDRSGDRSRRRPAFMSSSNAGRAGTARDAGARWRRSASAGKPAGRGRRRPAPVPGTARPRTARAAPLRQDRAGALTGRLVQGPVGCALAASTPCRCR